MGVRKIALRRLSKDVRSFLAQVQDGERIVVEDETGRARYGVTAYIEATGEEKNEAWKRLQRLQRKVGKVMKDQNITEEDVECLLLEDD